MIYSPIEEHYIQWLCDLINVDPDNPHMHLLRRLYWRTFEPIFIKRDENRAADGENLRIRFADEVGLDPYDRDNNLYNHPCSVLEMLIAMSIRCENQIMHNPDLGDRTFKWFWMMLDNMDISKYDSLEYTDDEIDAAVDQACDILIYRDFKHDGSDGGIFVLPGTKENLRDVEFWYHMCWAMSDYIKRNGV